MVFSSYYALVPDLETWISVVATWNLCFIFSIPIDNQYDKDK
jgi:hypothetical protein